MSSQNFSDHFSSLAAQYSDFRPSYPPELFDWLSSLTPTRALAWDCAAGSGQASVQLAERFERVLATDASAQQIAAATPHPRIDYRAALAEASGLPDASVDVLTVAQALHWFDLDRFYAEARRVLKPQGVLAVWTYGVLWFEDVAINQRVQVFYRETVGPYWPPERRHVENGYRELPFPFDEIKPPSLRMKTSWSLPQLLGYLRSWSATGRYVQAIGTDPVLGLAEELGPLWGNPQQELGMTWPLALRVGRLPA